MKKSILKFFLLFIFIASSINISGYNLRQFTSRNGLSNSAILSMSQDSVGNIWIGTCDGLNFFDGNLIKLYRSKATTKNQLSGNLIKNIIGNSKETNILWIQTNYGLDRLDTHKEQSLNFPQFKDNSLLAESKSNNLIVLNDDGFLYYYNASNSKFIKIQAGKINFNQVLDIAVDSNDVLWIFTHNKTLCFKIIEKESGISLQQVELFKQNSNFINVFCNDNSAYIVDTNNILYELDYKNHNLYYVAELNKEIQSRGEVSSIIKNNDDFYIGFKSNGLIILKHRQEEKNQKYEYINTEIKSGIFCLIKDKFQDIIWVGSDGQGVYMLYNNHYVIENMQLNTPAYNISNPIRSIFYDNERNLWVGTKGNGIIRFNNFVNKDKYSSFDRINTSNSCLTDNSVYCISQGNNGILWIGTERGINCYSLKKKQIYEFNAKVNGRNVRFVHSITQLNDTTLWVSTVGDGLVKIILRNTKNNIPQIKYATEKVFDNGLTTSNYFFTSFQENESLLWFGNRGLGAYKLNTVSEKFSVYKFNKGINSPTVNDIFAIYKNDLGYWIGTSAGLVYLKNENAPAILCTNGTVHGILEDKFGQLWISTNQGIIRFNPQTQTGLYFNAMNGMEIIEFSDGAFYKDPQTDILFFGGTNGLAYIVPNVSNTAKTIMPEIHLKGISVFGKDSNIFQFLSYENGQEKITLDYDKNFFNIEFGATDYISGNNFIYQYRLKEVSEQWIENNTSGFASFSNLSAGNYTMEIKYKNPINGEDSQIYSYIIRIMPPWYLSFMAYIIYFVLFVLVCACVIWELKIQYKHKRAHIMEKMDRQKKEELYESKLRFFTNITHEFCTPLTLIYGPCEKILSYTGADEYVKRYSRMIQQNAEKLNNLILELLEFRRLETGNKVLKIESLPVSEKLEQFIGSFDETADSRKISYISEIDDNIKWNTDLSCFNKIIANLLSNAFKYTPDGGTINVGMNCNDNKLVIKISNTGAGILPENIDKIFDRYKILDSVESDSHNNRNGLGLAICKSMVSMLNGEIMVESIPNENTTFTVILPEQQITAQESVPLTAYETQPVILNENKTIEGKELHNEMEFDTGKLTILVIDDDPSMLWLISDIFRPSYNVISRSNANEALHSMEQHSPDLIISDIMMPGTDGISLTEIIKQNKLWCHIPIILLSALQREDDKIKGIESGADAYVTKPFNINYLEKIVKRIIDRENELKEYYNSVFSSYTIKDGVLFHQQDQELIIKIKDIIEKNISNPDLSVDMLSRELGYSTRQFYRILKPITEKSPSDIIKECRLKMAERLLVVKKNLTVEEVMYQTGFNNRGTFYKLFSQQYGMPPRQYREQCNEKIGNSPKL